jgi:EAL domain-containing protein (putative c-di-GMP-specific phosphodiesterase class I)
MGNEATIKMNVATRTTSHELILLDVAYRLANLSDLDAQIAMHLHLSNLQPRWRSEAYVRVAASTFEPLVQKRSGQVFVLANGDIVFLSGRSSDEEVEDILAKLQQMFGEDPWFHDAQKTTTLPFATWYRLPEDAAAFVTTCEQLKASVGTSRAGVSAGQNGQNDIADMQEAGAAELDTALSRIDGVDMKLALRRQSIGLFLPGQPVKRLFSELYVSVLDLHKRLSMSASLAQNRWLFQHFTLAMDQAVLTNFIENGIPQKADSLSLNINVSTILSPIFLEFDQTCRRTAEDKIILELNQIDIFDDLPAYKFACNFLRLRGYAICVDGVTHLTFPFIDRESLGADFIKIVWSADMAGNREDNLGERMQAYVAKTGASSVILCRCDTKESIEWGQKAGIRLFQGRIVETLIESTASARREISAVS